jgi:polyisoprenyl-teichoic acid--peptidoglycan teichoic acid transferase
MELTNFRHKPLATLRQRVEARRARERRINNNLSPREARATLEILGTLDEPTALPMARRSPDSNNTAASRLHAVESLFGLGAAYALEEAPRRPQPAASSPLPASVHLTTDQTSFSRRLSERRSTHPPTTAAPLEGSGRPSFYRSTNVIFPRRAQAEPAYPLHASGFPPGMLRRLPSPQIDWRMLEEWLPRLFALLLVSVVAFSFFTHWWNGRQGKNGAVKAVVAAPPAQVTPTVTPAKKTTILILGSDRRAKDPSYRTDVIVLVTVDPAKGEVSTVSFPRDLVAKIPGYGDDRINVVMERGGFALMQDTFENSYGARPQYYFMTNFDGFKNLINSVGGVEVEAANALTDACDLYWSKAGTCEIKPGKHMMDGNTALWYIRSRHSTNDFDRLRRAQEVLKGLFARFMTMDALARAPELYTQYSANIETNMNIGQMLSLLPVAAKVAQDPDQLHRYAISPNEAADWFMASGARVLLPDYQAVKNIVREAGAGE